MSNPDEQSAMSKTAISISTILLLIWSGKQSFFENLSAMNRSTLLLFLCVFALSEVLLAAKKARIRGVVGRKNSSYSRFVRSASFPNDNQCKKMCKDNGASGGSALYDCDDYCNCDGELEGDWTKPDCEQACKTLGLKFAKLDDEGFCLCSGCK
ncbi:hypothetical protein Ddc_19183 [Ditylenchus destructor]|nr:hypothetical protein Ddc_19183 [Ditylenchus destructor]